MKPIDSAAVGGVDRIFGLGRGGAQTADLEDGNVSMVFEVTDAVRRARAIGVTEGWFIGLLDNIHPAAGAVESGRDPYAAGAAFVTNAYPAIVRPGFDVWFLGASVLRISGTGDINAATLMLDPPATTQGWGIDSGGVAVVANTEFPLLLWTALDLTISTREVGVLSGGGVLGKVAYRLPRGGAVLRFVSDASAIATFRCNILMAVFPEAIGQDIAS